MIDDQDLGEVVQFVTNEVNDFEDPSSQNSIVPISQDQPLSQNKESSQVSKYQVVYEFLIAELNRRYGLRPKQGPGRNVKNVTFGEPQEKATETPSIQPQNQLQDQSSIEKYVTTIFNVERELERVKIPIPLFELLRNLGYK